MPHHWSHEICYVPFRGQFKEKLIHLYGTHWPCCKDFFFPTSTQWWQNWTRLKGLGTPVPQQENLATGVKTPLKCLMCEVLMTPTGAFNCTEAPLCAEAALLSLQIYLLRSRWHQLAFMLICEGLSRVISKPPLWLLSSQLWPFSAHLSSYVTLKQMPHQQVCRLLQLIRNEKM